MNRRENRRDALDRRQQAISELKRRNVWGYVEPILTMGSAIVAEPVSGLAGLVALPYGASAADRAIKKVQEAMTYQPRTEEGQGAMQAVGEFMQPVGDAFIGASEYLGDAAYEATGSPALGAAAYSVPTMALEAIGLKGAKHATRGHRAFEVGDIGKQGSQFGGRQRGIFAGIKAKGADLDAQAAAAELARRGVDRKEIWSKTGWFEDVDGNWKWEIDDSQAKLRQEGLRSFHNESDLVRQNRMMEHSLLSEAYPDADYISYRKANMNGASYDPSSDTIRLPQDAGHPDMFPEMQESTVKSPALHELQHAIQEREGFARGGDPNRLGLPKEEQFRLAKQAYEASAGDGQLLAELGIDLGLPKTRKAWGELTKREQLGYLEEGRNRAYMRLAGEAEARNVQTRMNMTPEQRRATAPWETLDVPEGELIVNKNGGGVAMSANTDYRIDHTAPLRDGNNTLGNLSDIYPDDIYDSNVSWRYYGHGGDTVGVDKETAKIVASFAGNPDKEVTIYRAVPKGVKDINKGDWITINKNYAALHGASWVDDGNYDIISKKVRAKDLATDGNSMHEWGYDPE